MEMSSPVCVHDRIQDSLYWIARYWRCHQLRERSFSIRGRQLPLCARCLGILVGPLTALICPNVDWRTSALLIMIFFADGTSQLLGLRESKNWLRFATGVGFSIAVTSLLLHGAAVCLSNIKR